ncbi:MAG TPA: DUF6428 family protein [Schlesneria sp.]|jgi:hypothetical protein
MNLNAFLKILSDSPNSAIQFRLPEGTAVPAHFHITEVARVQKDFIDCGGTLRSEAACVLQVWVADDVEHRLQADKLAGIFAAASALLKSDDLPMEIEYETDTISRFKVSEADVVSTTITLKLEAIHTGCLAPDRCGVGLNLLPVVGCGPTGCC